GDLAVQGRVHPLVDHGHSALADLLEDLVLIDGPADHGAPRTVSCTVTFLSDGGNGVVLLRCARMFRWGFAALLVSVAVPARASIADWRVNEVLASADGDGGTRYIELFVPVGTAGNCLFPTTRIAIYDGEGQLLGTVAPFADTVCYAGGSFFLLA